MLAGLIIAVAIAAVAVVALAVVLRDRVAWRSLERRHAVVVLADTETTIDGVLIARRGPLLVLRNVTVFTGARAEGTPADGEVVVERARVAWMQVTS